MQFVDVKTDIAFKKIFGSEQHKEILIGFLNALLELEGDKCIKDVTLKNPWQPPDIPLLKETILEGQNWGQELGSQEKILGSGFQDAKLTAS